MVPTSTSKPSTATEDADTSMTDAAANPNTKQPSSNTSNPKKRKRKDKTEKEVHILHTTTFRRTTWSYFHLSLVTPSTLTTTSSFKPPTSNSSTTAADLSPLLISTLLISPLRSYLGTTGAAIPLDILKCSGRDVWIRLPRQDARALRAAMSSWAGSACVEDILGEGEGRVGVAWRVVTESGVLGMVLGDGAELFGG